MQYTLDDLAMLAQEVGSSNPIDFSGLNIDQNSAYRLMAANILELFQDPEYRELRLLATVTHLTVENFALNVRLLRIDQAAGN